MKAFFCKKQETPWESHGDEIHLSGRTDARYTGQTVLACYKIRVLKTLKQ